MSPAAPPPYEEFRERVTRLVANFSFLDPRDSRLMSRTRESGCTLIAMILVD
jgi:hypothetical protein